MATHNLERTGIKTSQDTEEKQASRGTYNLEWGRGWDRSGHRKKTSQQGATHKLERPEVKTGQDMQRPARALTSWRGQRSELVRTWKESEPVWALTSWRVQKSPLIRIWKESKPARGHLLPGESRGQDWSEHGKKVN